MRNGPIGGCFGPSVLGNPRGVNMWHLLGTWALVSGPVSLLVGAMLHRRAEALTGVAA